MNDIFCAIQLAVLHIRIASHHIDCWERMNRRYILSTRTECHLHNTIDIRTPQYWPIANIELLIFVGEFLCKKPFKILSQCNSIATLNTNKLIHFGDNSFYSSIHVCSASFQLAVDVQTIHKCSIGVLNNGAVKQSQSAFSKEFWNTINTMIQQSLLFQKHLFYVSYFYESFSIDVACLS